jgi:hypothetical protein
VSSIRLNKHDAGDGAILHQNPIGESVSNSDQDEADVVELDRELGQPAITMLQPRHNDQWEGYTYTPFYEILNQSGIIQI